MRKIVTIIVPPMSTITFLFNLTKHREEGWENSVVKLYYIYNTVFNSNKSMSKSLYKYTLLKLFNFYENIIAIDWRYIPDENKYKHSFIRTTFNYTLLESFLKNYLQLPIIDNSPISCLDSFSSKELHQSVDNTLVNVQWQIYKL